MFRRHLSPISCINSFMMFIQASGDVSLRGGLFIVWRKTCLKSNLQSVSMTWIECLAFISSHEWNLLITERRSAQTTSKQNLQTSCKAFNKLPTIIVLSFSNINSFIITKYITMPGRFSSFSSSSPFARFNLIISIWCCSAFIQWWCVCWTKLQTIKTWALCWVFVEFLNRLTGSNPARLEWSDKKQAPSYSFETDTIQRAAQHPKTKSCYQPHNECT